MPGPSSSLPPYLVSGASSRAHHGLLTRLHEAASVQEEDEIISKEIRRAKETLAVRGQSTSKLRDTLIILLHCQMLRHRTEDNIEFAFVPALQLAEGGHTLAERRTGYLYLVERLPKKHELNLLLINTIRKDLSSTSSSCVLLALQTIAKIPSTDLAPAVIPLLTSKSLLKHNSPAVRQRTFEALLSLHQLSPNDEQFPLTMNKLLKSLQREDDMSVLAVILRLIRHLLETSAHHIHNDTERLYVIDKCLEAARQNEVRYEGQIAVEVVKVLGALVERKEDFGEHDASQMVSRWVIDTMNEMGSVHGGQGAFLLEICHLANILPALAAHILAQISQLLVPDDQIATSSASPSLPSPNDHVLAIRCLGILPTSMWDGRLEEMQMGVIMHGVNSVDDTIRKLTLSLLQSLSPDLPEMILQTHFDSIRHSTDLSLPMSLANGLTLKEKTQIGRNETASRALEVVEARFQNDGDGYACGVVELLEALESGNDYRDGHVWAEGVRRIQDYLEYRSPSFAHAFTTSVLESLRGMEHSSSDTLIVVFTSIACERLPLEQIPEALDYLSRIIPQHNGELTLIHFMFASVGVRSLTLCAVLASTQELIMVTLVALLTCLDDEIAEEKGQMVLNTIQEVQKGSSRYLKKVSQTLGKQFRQRTDESAEMSGDINNHQPRFPERGQGSLEHL
uniref:Clathrin/coatomer adaptor adaptin-like N-terminal domain-containing protein n=1 Tax=Kwoniella pini CBS 10737 TaxID=1296096 RepID=A0A1B9HWY6_9TREE|nr:uncharacterized protein I206_06687 [Kwoniella pini CBS 10737]OCF47780.1 hypothetical protein I206_06687 [Kwoniella pini CBS 10737]